MDEPLFLFIIYHSPFTFMKCPTCGEPVKWQDNPYRPFCSERCKLIDFGRWANGEYRVPGEEKPLEEAETANSPANDSRSTEDE
jgi:endogenous inhibitor of DNA gyrase (YacG/DUF329 family)